MPKSDQLKGTKELARKLSELGAAAGGKALRNAALLAMTPVVSDAKRRIPVNDRDYLKRSYKGTPIAPGFAKSQIAKKTLISRDKTRAYALVGVKPEAYYATQFVERGTSKQPAQPWLRPAFRTNRREVLRRLANQLRKNIMKVAKGK